MRAILLSLCCNCWAPVPREALPDQYAPGYFGVFLTAEATSVQINELVKDGPAERAGLLPGDVLVKIDSFEVNGNDTLREMIISLRPGVRVPVTVKRRGESMTFLLRVMPKPQ